MLVSSSFADVLVEECFEDDDDDFVFFGSSSVVDFVLLVEV
jgi:hypothetical protein